MRVVLDTNVVVSAILSPRGAPARIIEAWRTEVFELLVSEPILAEYQRALSYTQVQTRHGMSAAEIAELVDGFRRFATLVLPGASLVVVKDDPDDDKFLECAVAGGAEYVVSGDPHLRDLKEYEGIQILRPAVFLAAFEQGKAVQGAVPEDRVVEEAERTDRRSR